MGALRIPARGLAVVAVGLAALAPGTPALSSQALAADLGCMNCHGEVHGTNHPSGARFTR